MKNNIKSMWIMCVTLSIFFTPTITIALPLSETLEAVADMLVSQQYTNNQYCPSCNGAWQGEYGYTGSIVAGLIQAYQVKGKDSYKEAAEKGIDYILNSYGGNFYGDEAYALARMTEVTGEQAYADLVLDFYNSLDTYAYISGFDATRSEKATFFISYHTVAAYMVGAKDKEIWREAIISYLSLVGDDLSYFPVMTLGVATWALSQTGPMDDTRIDPFGLGGSYWKNVTLRDLPDLLSTHQVLSGQYAGSFYVRFDHRAPGSDYEAAGYTEDTIFGLLGMIAVDAVGSTDDAALPEDTGSVDENSEANDDVRWDFEDEIQNAREVLVQSVRRGLVQEHIWSGSQIYYFFGGELLQTLSE